MVNWGEMSFIAINKFELWTKKNTYLGVKYDKPHYRKGPNIQRVLTTELMILIFDAIYVILSFDIHMLRNVN